MSGQKWPLRTPLTPSPGNRGVNRQIMGSFMTMIIGKIEDGNNLCSSHLTILNWESILFPDHDFDSSSRSSRSIFPVSQASSSGLLRSLPLDWIPFNSSEREEAIIIIYTIVKSLFWLGHNWGIWSPRRSIGSQRPALISDPHNSFGIK